MRISLALVLLVAACGDDGGAAVEDAPADATVVDGQAADASIDASVDAPPDAMLVDGAMNITTACTNACTAIGVCEGGDPTELQGCIAECSKDLVDCTAQQVADVDACSQQSCAGDPSPLEVCLDAIACLAA